MFRKMTKGQLIALATILKMSTARSSGESVSVIGKGKYGTEPQLGDVALILVKFMFSGLTQTFFLPGVAPKIRSFSCGQFDG